MICSSPIAANPLASAGGGDSALSGAQILLPRLTLVASGRPVSQAILTLPMLSLKANGGGFAAVGLPMLTLQAQGAPSRNRALLTLPMLGLQAQMGHSASLVLPMLQVSSTATSVGWGKASLSLPMLTVSTDGSAGGVARASLSLPAMGLTAQGGHNASLTLPMLTLDAAATAGSLGNVALTLPMFTLDAAAKRDGHLKAALTLPMLQLNATPSGAALTLPAMQLVAIGGEHIAIRYEAYSVNLTHRREGAVDEVTCYTNYPFDNIVRLGQKYYGVARDGLYELGGDTDFAEPTPTAIPWAWKTGITDFDSVQRKTVLAAVFAGRLGPEATIELFVGESGSESYAFTTPRGQVAQNYREKFGRGLRDSYYALGAAGEGALSLDSINFDIQILSRRI